MNQIYEPEFKKKQVFLFGQNNSVKNARKMKKLKLNMIT